MTIYILTFKSTARHDAEKRADLNLFLKQMKRTFGLKCIDIQEHEVQEKKPSRARRATPRAAETQREFYERMGFYEKNSTPAPGAPLPGETRRQV